MKETVEELERKKIIDVETKYSNHDLMIYIEERVTKEELFKKMVHLIKEKSDAIDEENDFFENVMEREKIGSTGVGMGIAIPHARFIGAKRVIIATALLKEGINFDAIDGEAVRLVVMVGAPKEMGKEYLTLIATLARAFRNKKYRENIMSATSTEQLIKAIEEFTV